MTTRRYLLPLALVPATMMLAACGSDPSSATTSAEVPSVVTALYPLAFVAERVGGDDISLTNLAAPGVEPHDLELAPQQVGSIVDADLVVYLDGFAPAVDKAVDQNAADRAFDVGSVITLVEAAGDDGHGHGAEDEQADQEEHSAEEDPDHASVDPHFWLDPHLVGELASSLADRLAELDPDHADDFATRAGALIGELDELDHAYEAALATCDTHTLVTAHAAFGYLAARYGLEQFSVAGLEPDAEPSAARIAEVQAEIEAEAVTTVYFEPLTSAAVVEAIAGDLGLDTAELDPIESVDPDSGDDYLAVMDRNLVALQVGQGCT